MRSEGITQLLVQWRNGDEAALNELLPQVYTELRRLADYYLRQERPGHTLQPTALVHEAYLRLLDAKEIDWQNRAHFFGIAAVRMRHILVEHARGRQAAKRGGGEYLVSLTETEEIADADKRKQTPTLTRFPVRGLALKSALPRRSSERLNPCSSTSPSSMEITTVLSPTMSWRFSSSIMAAILPGPPEQPHRAACKYQRR
jgi:RNA polymerase sigma factor (TIGR02999 family)